ncbi:MAG: hypothetical protein WAU17_03150 [Nitrospirales bacterium]
MHREDRPQRNQRIQCSAPKTTPHQQPLEDGATPFSQEQAAPFLSGKEHRDVLRIHELWRLWKLPTVEETFFDLMADWTKAGLADGSPTLRRFQ